MSYNYFADYYDSLTKNVDYPKWAEYYCKIIERYGAKPGITLDLACGTGSLTIELAKCGLDVYGIDSSPEMLTKAQEKMFDEGMSILFLMQKMQTLNLYGTINTCICALDSINHLPRAKDVQAAFDKVAFFMEKDGLFIFDVNTVYKHKNILANNTFVYDTDNVYCVWQNFLDEDGVTVDIVLDFFEKIDGSYYRSSESFKERAYTDEEITQMLEKSGFTVLDRFAELSFDAPTDTTERVFYAAKHILDPGTFFER